MGIKKPVLILLSICFCAALWYVAAAVTDSPLVLPYPHEVFARLFQLVPDAQFRLYVGATLWRSMCAFGISVAVSLVLGVSMGLLPPLSVFFSVPLSVIKATPVVSFILLAVFWFSSDRVPVFVSVLMTLPVMTSAVASGVRNTSRELSDMARVYGLTRRQKIRWLIIPSMLPYFFSGALSSLGLTWKVVVAGEILCLPRYSVGTALQTAKVHLETVDVFAWTLAVVVLSYGCELLFALYTAKIRRAENEPQSL